jgi:hypothetical protein
MRVVSCPNCDQDVEVESRPTVRLNRRGILLVDDQHVVAMCLGDGWMAKGHIENQRFIIDHQTGVLAQEHDEES